jgi:hypothetical protein
MASVQRITGKPCILNYLCTSAGQAFSRGDLVRLDTAGTLVIATDGAAANNAGILGIAMADAPASTTTPVPVDIISSDGSLFVRKAAETAATAILGAFQTTTFTKGAHTMTSGAGATIIVGYVDPIGTTTPRAICKFCHEMLQSEIGIAI